MKLVERIMMIKFFLTVINFLITISAFAQFNNSAHFFGDQGYISVPSDASLNPTQEITVETWIKIDSLHSSQIGITGTWDDKAGNLRTYFLWIFNNRVEFLVSPNGSFITRVTGSTLQIDTWYHIAATADGSTLKLYLNNNLDAQKNYTSNINSNNQPFYIGRTESGSNATDYFFGWIDELRVWNVARSQQQINQTSNDTLSALYYSNQDSGLVAYYRFDRDVADTTDFILDLSAELNHGIIIGEVAFDTTASIITSITDKRIYMGVQRFELFQNYPNPFNPITTISYYLSRASLVNLYIYNILGQQVAKLDSGMKTSGLNTVQWDASNFPSGVYFYRLQTDFGFSENKKLILLK